MAWIYNMVLGMNLLHALYLGNILRLIALTSPVWLLFSKRYVKQSLSSRRFQVELRNEQKTLNTLPEQASTLACMVGCKPFLQPCKHPTPDKQLESPYDYTMT